MNRRTTGLWIAIVLGIGCIACIVVLAAFEGDGTFVTPRENPRMETEVAPDAGLPICPRPGPEDIRVFLLLTPTRFVLVDTAGVVRPLPYSGDAYPLEALREELAYRRQIEPNRRDLVLRTEPGVPASVRRQVVALAREVGFVDVCRQLDPARQIDGGRRGSLREEDRSEVLGSADLISDDYFCRSATTTSAGRSAVRAAC